MRLGDRQYYPSHVCVELFDSSVGIKQDAVVQWPCTYLWRYSFCLARQVRSALDHIAVPMAQRRDCTRRAFLIVVMTANIPGNLYKYRKLSEGGPKCGRQKPKLSAYSNSPLGSAVACSGTRKRWSRIKVLKQTARFC